MIIEKMEKPVTCLSAHRGGPCSPVTGNSLPSGQEGRATLKPRVLGPSETPRGRVSLRFATALSTQAACRENRTDRPVQTRGRPQGNESGRCSISLYLPLPVKEVVPYQKETKSEAGAGTLGGQAHRLGESRSVPGGTAPPPVSPPTPEWSVFFKKKKLLISERKGEMEPSAMRESLISCP